MNIKAVIFDLFETLVDFPHENYFNAVRQIAAYVDVTEELFIKSWQDNWHEMETGSFASTIDFIRHVSSAYNSSPDEDALIKGAAVHYEIEKVLLNPRDQATKTLSYIKNINLKTAMITNCPLETPILWPETELSKHIDIALFSCAEKLRKPDPELFKRCSGRLGLKPDECIFIGDGANDELAAARHAGMMPVLLNNGCINSAKKMAGWDGLVINCLSNCIDLIKIKSPL